MSTVVVNGAAGAQSVVVDQDLMEIMPLGSGQEVGRSCVVVKFKGSCVMFDCGIHPAHSGLQSFPFFDEIDPSTVDLLLITHFHMDHCGAVPYFTEKTNFKGRVFMTHPTKAIYKILLHDAAKIGSDDDKMYDEGDLLNSMAKIETINYHQLLQHKGVKFSCYNAGHVLGAAMFQIEVSGVRVLYTGDFSRNEDRHLLGAEAPPEPPHVLIVESTFGVQLHDPQEVRERRFTQKIHEIIKRGGRCLIPVFALGRSQELLLILDEYWRDHPELHSVPIFYASPLAKKCMRVYQTYINMMNGHIRDAHAEGRNPWDFEFVRNLQGGTSQLDDSQPMVIMASPGMMQNGLSRELFEMWCSDRRNGLMMPGYSVAGTLAHHVLNEPKEIVTSAGDRVPVNLSIDYISFSAHSDYAQTSEFVAALRPAHVVLVHGAKEEMGRLKGELSRHYEPSQTEFLTPDNCQPVQLRFRGDKLAKVVGALAQAAPADGASLGGLLLKKDFTYTLMAADDLKHSTNLACAALAQRPSFHFAGDLAPLLKALRRLFPLRPAGGGDGGIDGGGGSGDGGDGSGLRWLVHDEVTLVHEPEREQVALEWAGGPLSDLIADAVVATLLQQQAKLPAAAAEPAIKEEGSGGSGSGGVAVKAEPGTEVAGAAEAAVAAAAPTLAETAAAACARVVLAALREHYGHVETAAASGEAAAAGADEAAGAFWELTACGHRVRLHGAAPPFARVECDDDDARARVEALLERTQKAVLPLG